MANRGKTVVCDNQTCVYGNYNVSNGMSAHMRLASAAGITPTYGAYIDSGRIGLRSESINVTNFGHKDLSGTSAGNWVSNQINSGNLQSVKQYKGK